MQNKINDMCLVINIGSLINGLTEDSMAIGIERRSDATAVDEEIK